jgi:FkbM family methyltransferase
VTKKLIKQALRKIGLEVIRMNELENIQLRARVAETRNKWIPSRGLTKFEEFILSKLSDENMYSQLQQDLIALHVESLFSSGPKYFVEFGASDGVTYSNTYLLEKSYGWSGILAEPAQTWHEQLSSNRNSIVDRRCVWSQSGEEIEFREATDAAYSTLESHRNSDHHSVIRVDGSTYFVQTVSLVDLLDSHKAPKTISFLSIDTEGSEYEILSRFDFSKYKFNLIAVEHNYSENREPIRILLEQNGYQRVLLAKSEWDDWYVRETSETEEFICENP